MLYKFHCNTFSRRNVFDAETGEIVERKFTFQDPGFKSVVCLCACVRWNAALALSGLSCSQLCHTKQNWCISKMMICRTGSLISPSRGREHTVLLIVVLDICQFRFVCQRSLCYSIALCETTVQRCCGVGSHLLFLLLGDNNNTQHPKNCWVENMQFLMYFRRGIKCRFPFFAQRSCFVIISVVYLLRIVVKCILGSRNLILLSPTHSTTGCGDPWQMRDNEHTRYEKTRPLGKKWKMALDSSLKIHKKSHIFSPQKMFNCRVV